MVPRIEILADESRLGEINRKIARKVNRRGNRSQLRDSSDCWELRGRLEGRYLKLFLKILDVGDFCETTAMLLAKKMANELQNNNTYFFPCPPFRVYTHQWPTPAHPFDIDCWECLLVKNQGCYPPTPQIPPHSRLTREVRYLVLVQNIFRGVLASCEGPKH